LYQNKINELIKAKTKAQGDKVRSIEDKPFVTDIPSISGAGVDVNTSAIVDIRPTTVSVDVPIRIKEKRIIPLAPEKDVFERSRKVPISVKVLPMTAKNFGDMYSVLMSDLYANKFSSAYRSAFRFLVGRFSNWFGPIGRKFLNFMIPKDQVDLYKDILYHPKGFMNSSSFRNKIGPSFQKYAAAIVIMSSDDVRHQEQNFFNKPEKMSKLFSMGWNSFGIMDDADSKLTFCSALDSGLCTQIPYQYLFHSLKALDIYKEMEQLSGFTRRIVGRFKRMNMKSLGEQLDVNREIEDKVLFTYNEFMESIENGSE
jgi:hypothetical protein